MEAVRDACKAIAAGDTALACQVLTLPSLLAASGADLVALGYENDPAYCERYLEANAPALADCILLADGLPTAAQRHGLPAGFLRQSVLKSGMEIRSLASSATAEAEANLAYFSKLIQKAASAGGGLAPETRKAMLDDIGTVLTTIQPMLTSAPALKLHARAAALATQGKHVKLAELGEALDKLAFELMPKSPADKARANQERGSDAVQQARADQIDKLRKENPGKTIIVWAGAATLYGSDQAERQVMQADPGTGKQIPKFTQAARARTGCIDLLKDSEDVLPLVLTRAVIQKKQDSSQPAPARVRYETARIKADEEQLDFKQRLLLMDFSLFKTG